MSWQTGLLLTGLFFLALWLACEVLLAARAMRRRSRKRMAIDRYCRKIEEKTP